MPAEEHAAALAAADRADVIALLDEQFPHEDGNVLRGVFFGVVFSIPCWGVIALGVWGISRLFA